MSASENPFSRFTDVVGSIDEIEAVVGPPMPQAVTKVTDRIDDLCRDFIARSPFCVIATTSPEGPVDLSPKGDPAGFVQVLDEKWLAIPDRPGNRRIDTFHNLMQDPRIGLIFLIPGKAETLRVSGEARIVRDRALLDGMTVNRKAPELAIAVHVTRAFVHCPKCMIRAKLWQPDAWPDSSGVVGIGEAMIAHGKLDLTPDEMFAEAEKAGVTRLY